MLAYILLAGLGAFFGFANPFLRFPLLALLLPFCLTRIALRAKSPRQALVCGLYASWLASLLPLYWIAIPAHDYGHVPWLLAAPLPVLLSFILGLYPMLYCWFIHQVKDRLGQLGLGIFAGCLWMSLEMARGYVFTGFPWLNLAVAFAPWPFAIQTLSLVGAYGLCGLLAAGAAWLALGRPLSWSGLSALLLFAAIALFGVLRLQSPLPEAEKLQAGVVQGNMDQSVKWEPGLQRETIDKYLRLSDSLDPESPLLLVWPETALPFFFQDDSPLSQKIRDYCKTKRRWILTGAPAYQRRPGKEPWLFNRAYLIGPDGQVAGYYDKEHLVPFGEYIPLAELLGELKESPHFKMFFEGVGDFRAGDNPKPLKLERAELGMLICYEVIFPELARARVQAGANLLLSISNDAWYGESSAPWQHQELAQLRAVEEERYFLRATNTGLSSIIDPYGRVLKQTGLYHDTAVGAEVSLLSGRTWFNQYANIINFGALALGLALFCAARLKGPSRGKL